MVGALTTARLGVSTQPLAPTSTQWDQLSHSHVVEPAPNTPPPPLPPPHLLRYWSGDSSVATTPKSPLKSAPVRSRVRPDHHPDCPPARPITPPARPPDHPLTAPLPRWRRAPSPLPSPLRRRR